jgi:branched-chain amino acid transport system permease protein
MVASGLAALLLGSIVTRASGLALAVATLMLPLIATGYISSAGYLGGSVGAPLTGNLWPGSDTQSIAIGNGLITVAVLGLVVLAATRILSSDIGLELYVLGVDEPTAAAMGVRTPRRRLELFVLGSVFAALGGAIYAGTQLFVPATLASPTAELALLMMLFVGGRRSVLGAVAGAVAIQYLSGASNWVSVNILIVEGVLLTAVLLLDPDGLAGIAATLAPRVSRCLRPRPPAVARAAPATPAFPATPAIPAAPAFPAFGRADPRPSRHGRTERPRRVVTDAGKPADGRARPRRRRGSPAAAARRARLGAQRS